MSVNRRASRLVHVVIGGLLMAGGAFAQQGPKLPAAAIEPKVRTACTECHDSHVLVQQRLSRGAWTKEVDKMIRWGAVVDAKDRDSFIDYFSTNFPADKPAFVPAGAATPTRKR